MPTVLRQDGFNIIIWTDDHAPPHIHIFRAGEELVVNLGDTQTGIEIRENKGMKRNNIRRAVDIIEANRFFLLQEWERIHGRT